MTPCWCESPPQWRSDRSPRYPAVKIFSAAAKYFLENCSAAVKDILKYFSLLLEISLVDSAMRPDLIGNCLKARNRSDKVHPSVSQSIVISWDPTRFDRFQHLSNVKTMLSMSDMRRIS